MMYGTVYGTVKNDPRKASLLREVKDTQPSLSFSTIVGLVCAPALIYTTVCFDRAMQIRYSSNIVSLFAALLILLAWCILTCGPSWDFSSSRSRLWTFLLITGIFAWSCGCGQGEHLFVDYFQPYYDINNLNNYPDVEVDKYRGQTLMDLGMVSFVPGTYLNLSMSYGFKNEDMYCVAPIVSDKMLLPQATVVDANPAIYQGVFTNMSVGSNTSASSSSSSSSSSSRSSSSSSSSTFSSTSSSSSTNSTVFGLNEPAQPIYDFWAVGTNCCSGHTADFACGEFNNPMAHSSLRLMRDDQRPYFRLAVEQSEASFNIKARHPVFLYWMQDPIQELNAYQDAGYKEFINGSVKFISVQLVLVVMAIVLFSKMSHS